MANTKISAASAITTLTDTDEVAVASGGASKKATVAQIRSRTRAGSHALPSGAFAESIPRIMSGSARSALVSQRVWLQSIELFKGEVVTSISFMSSSTALGSGNHQYFGLYNSSLTLLATSADDTSTSWGTHTVKTLAMTSPYTVTASGLYYAACLVDATTVPNLNGAAYSPSFSNAHNLTPKLQGHSSTGQTSLPATAGAITTLELPIWCYIS